MTRTIIDERDFWDIKRDEMVGESSVIRSITDELHFSNIQRDHVEG